MCTDPAQYRKLFRFSLQHTEWLAEQFLGNTGESRGGALSPHQKMEVTLRFLGDPGFQEGIGYDMGLSQPTISRTVAECIPKIAERVNDWVKWPNSMQEIAKVGV